MATLTVFTPAYNRAELLIKLYQSLERQTNKDFCWMVVDDGSLDNTYELVSTFAESASFDIACLRKSNGGKHTALNFGIERTQTPLTMIVDSDDYLTSDAVSSIIDIHSKYSQYENISSYSFLKGNSKREVVVPIEQDEFIENYIKYRIKEHRPGDMAEVFKTEYLKKFPFPEYPNEKFISEDVVWIQIGKNTNTVYINKVIYVCEYLEGGLTDSDKKMKFLSPLGSMMRGKQLMSEECGVKENIRGAIIYNVYAREARKKGIYNEISISFRERVLVCLTKLLTLYFYKKWHRGI